MGIPTHTEIHYLARNQNKMAGQTCKAVARGILKPKPCLSEGHPSVSCVLVGLSPEAQLPPAVSLTWPLATIDLPLMAMNADAGNSLTICCNYKVTAQILWWFLWDGRDSIYLLRIAKFCGVTFYCILSLHPIRGWIIAFLAVKRPRFQSLTRTGYLHQFRM